MCTRVFDTQDKNSMKFDDFIQCCVMLKSLTDKFKSIDTDHDGIVDVSYEQVHTCIPQHNNQNSQAYMCDSFFMFFFSVVS